MRACFLCTLVLLACVCLSFGQHGRIPSLTHAEQQPNPTDNLPSTLPAPTQRLDSTRMQSQAEELSNLAQSIPGEVKAMSKGTLPKDLNEKLKRIEKLCKSLRSDLER